MSDTSLEKAIKELSAINAHHYDPVRFAFIQSLFTRLSDSKHGRNKKLVDKIRTSLNQYKANFERRRLQANDVVDAVALNFPGSADAARSLFEQCKFKQLERFSTRLNEQKAKLDNRAELTSLIAQINQRVNTGDERLSFDDVLLKQEQEALDAAGYAGQVISDGSGEQLELQSMKYLRESLKYYEIDRVIARAINEMPENPGPHNPHMLAIKSLMHMHNLSPQYLRRFAAYIETLLWLEKNSTKLNNLNQQ